MDAIGESTLCLPDAPSQDLDAELDKLFGVLLVHIDDSNETIRQKSLGKCIVYFWRLRFDNLFIRFAETLVKLSTKSHGNNLLNQSKEALTKTKHRDQCSELVSHLQSLNVS